jgi:uncharacterized membrane protein
VAHESHPRRRLPRFIRIFTARPRLSLAALVGVGAALLAPRNLWPTGLIAGWDIAVAFYLVAALQLCAGSDVARMRQRAEMEDEGRVGILFLTVVAALASLAAIIAFLSHTARDALQLGLATLTILLSWAFIHTMFALHYAHEFYSEGGGKTRGLVFPREEQPDYWDFLYFSFVIGMTSQVSDVAIVSKPIRRTVVAHGIVAFLFNTALLALIVNIAASAI